MINDESSVYLSYAETLKHPIDFTSAVNSFFNEDVVINIAHPFNEMKGTKAYLEFFLLPLQDSFERLYRRDDIFMLGEFDGQRCVSSTGYYVGQFTKE